MPVEKLYHVSEDAGIDIFQPRPPSFFEGAEGNVVFAVSEKMLHNYLLTRIGHILGFVNRYPTVKISREMLPK